jgi:hypothetical protein
MKGYERLLLSHLQEDNSQGKNDPLADVKNAMGEIAYSAGNPLTKTEITLQITLEYYDFTAAAPILPAALSPDLQKSLPVFLFGLTDYYGGYKKNRLLAGMPLINPVGRWILADYLILAAYQTTLGIVGYNCVNTGIVGMFNPIDPGDLIMVFNGIQLSNAHNIVALLKVHCNNVAYGTFLNSFVSDLITINTLRLIVPIANINQYLNALTFGYQTLFGKTFADSVDPRMYITSTDFQQQICDIPINLPIDKAVMLGYQLNYNCQNMSIVLFVEKIEPLTHKSNISKKH